MSLAVDVRDLTIAYGDLLAIDNLAFAVPTGSVAGVLGPNGAGKTTLVRTLATLIPPTSGRVEVAGFDVTRSGDRVRERIGLSGQYSAVDADLTVAENIHLISQLVGGPCTGRWPTRR